jgi:hypothetical protein
MTISKPIVALLDQNVKLVEVMWARGLSVTGTLGVQENNLVSNHPFSLFMES